MTAPHIDQMNAGGGVPLLSVRHLRVEFPGRRGTLVAIDDVSFDIARGEVLGVVGESGAGKSLTGAAIIGLLEPPGRIAGGEILLDGERIDNLRAERLRRLRGRRIAMIFQDPLTSLNPLYTVGQQLVETMLTHLDIRPAAARERALALLDEVGIPAPAQRIDHYPHQFSGGMRQRVVSAIALAGNPRLLIADEPTTSLDVTVQAHFLRLLREIQDSHGLSIVFVTHDLGVIARICHRAAVMYAGRIVEEAPVRQLFAAPAHPYTRALLEASPRLEARKRPLTWIAGQPPSPRARPPGCAFAPRCPAAMERCRREAPPEIWIDQRQRAACWLHANGEDERHRDG